MTDPLPRLQPRDEMVTAALLAVPDAPAASTPAAASALESFGAVFLAEVSYVHTSLRRLGVRERDLDDVAHEVFLAVYRHWSAYDPARPVRPWLFGFALRMASDYRRQARHQREVMPGALEAADPGPAADERLIHAQRRALVIAALEDIDLDRRAVFVMHDLDELPMPEIAAALGIPLNTAYSRLRLAREEFATAVRRRKARRELP